MAKYIDLHNLKENLTNFLNKKIDPIYAKKTEVPQVTVVDDALSSTSTNPVQNKVVKAEFDQVNSNLSALNNSKLKGYTVEYNVPANSGGWHKIAQITGGYFNFDLYATGSWSNQRKSNAHFQIQNIFGTVRIVQLSGLADTGGGIKAIRMVRVVDDHDTWILEEHSSSSTNGELFRFTIAGDVTVTPLDGSVDTTIDTDFKDSVSLDVSDIPTGTVITTSNIDNALSSTSANPVQNKVVKAEFDNVNSNLDWLQYSEVAGGKNLFNPKCLLNAIYDEKTHTITVSNNIDKALDMVFKENTQYTFSAYIKQSSPSTNNRFSVKYTDGTSDNPFLFSSSTSEVYLSNTSKSGKTISEVNWYYGSSGTATFRNFQIEEGDIATPYEPYIPSVKMLAEEVDNVNESLSALGKCKNLLKPTLQTTTQNGVTCTNNGDGTYTLNGTSTKDTDFVLFYNLEKYQHLKNRTVKLVGCPKGGSTTTYRLMLQLQQPPWLSAVDIGEGASVTVDDNDNWVCWVKIYENATVSNLTFKPMLVYDDKTPNATYDDFVPYTGDGETLASDVAEIKNDLSDLKDGTTPAAKAVADEDGNNIKSTYAKKTEAFIDYSHISVDLNTLTKAPSLISIGYDIDNKPPKFMGGYMLVVNAGYTASIALYQILFDVYYNKTYQRKYYHGSWSAWSDVTTPQDAETTTLTTTSGTATLYKLGKMRHLVLNDATFSSIAVLTSTDASVGSLYFRAEVLFNSGDDLEGGSASFEDICIGGSNMWNATRTATGASPVAVKGATGSATWMVQ